MSDGANGTEDSDIASMSGLYALDALEGDDLRYFEQHLEVNSAARDEVAEFRETAARLGSVVSESAPERMREAVLGRLDSVRQEPIRLDVVRARRRSRMLQRVASVAAAMILIATVGLGGFIIGERSQSPVGETASPAQEVVNLMRQPDAQIVQLTGEGGPSALLVHTSSGPRAVLMSDEMEPLPDGKVYELWRIQGEGTPEPAGLFHSNDEGLIRKGINLKLAPGDTVAVTVEPAGGSIGPTLPIVMSGTAA